MSERLMKPAGIVMLIMTVLLIAAGCFPAETHKEQTCRGRGIPESVPAAIPHLSSDDVTNRGETEELESLYGIGPTLAQSIQKERMNNGLFIYPEDLISVNGIGKARLALILPEMMLLTGESEE